MTDLTPYSLFIAIVVVIGAVNMLAMIMFVKRVRTNAARKFNRRRYDSLSYERPTLGCALSMKITTKLHVAQT